MAIFMELAPSECIKDGHPHVNGKNVTNTQRYLRNSARYDATNSLARTHLHLLSLTRNCSNLLTLELSRTL